MPLLTILLVPLFGLAGMVLLFGVLSPVPILRPALAGLVDGTARRLRPAFARIELPELPRAARHDARIAALELSNRSLEARVAELTECVLRSLAISLETQQKLEVAEGDNGHSRPA